MARKKVARKRTVSKQQRPPKRLPKSLDDPATTLNKKATNVVWVNQFTDYLKGVRAEFDKVTWADRKQTAGITVAVLAITFFFAAYLGLVDLGLTRLLNLLY